MLKQLEKLYEIYKFSYPDGTKSRYFKGYNFEDIPDDELVKAVPRSVAKEAIEACLENIKWDESTMGDGWFWQSEVHPELVLLRKWFKKEKEN